MIIDGFSDELGNLTIIDPTELTSTAYRNGIQLDSDVNVAIEPPNVSKGGNK